MAIRSEVEDTILRRVQYTGQPRGPSGGPVMAVNTAVAAAGSDNTDAGLIAQGGFTRVTGADGTKGVILFGTENGVMTVIKNGTNAILKVYPHAGAAINGLTATTGALSMAANTSAVFFKETNTQWWTLPLLPS